MQPVSGGKDREKSISSKPRKNVEEGEEKDLEDLSAPLQTWRGLSYGWEIYCRAAHRCFDWRAHSSSPHHCPLFDIRLS